LFDVECERWDEDLVVSMFRDAAKQVPELAELAAPIIHEDAPLIDADIEIQWCQERLAEENPTPLNRPAEIRQKLNRLLERGREAVPYAAASPPRQRLPCASRVQMTIVRPGQ
jgi:hypothetical protein